MVIHNRLHREMQRFFDLLSDFELAADEKIVLIARQAPRNLHVESGAPRGWRCADVRQVSQFALQELATDVQLDILIVRSGSRVPRSKDIKLRLGSWVRRWRNRAEENLQDQVWRLQGSPSGELHLTYVYPSGDTHVCEATICMDRSRYRGPAPLNIFDVLRDRAAPFSAG
jgi:hypothetical protein